MECKLQREIIDRLIDYFLNSMTLHGSNRLQTDKKQPLCRWKWWVKVWAFSLVWRFRLLRGDMIFHGWFKMLFKLLRMTDRDGKRNGCLHFKNRALHLLAIHFRVWWSSHVSHVVLHPAVVFECKNKIQKQSAVCQRGRKISLSQSRVASIWLPVLC